MSSLKVHAHTFDIGTPYGGALGFKTHLLGLVRNSLDQGAQVILLPAYTGYGLAKLNDFKTKESIAKVIWTEVFPEIMKLSEEHDALICAGTAPNLHRDTKKFRNRAILAASGKSFDCYQRCLSPWESDFESGNSPLFYDWKGYKFANLIGFDLEFPELATEIKRFGPHFILCPVATAENLAMERVSLAARARAMELGSVVVVSSLVGTDESNPLVDTNEGRLAFYYPVQEAYRGTSNLQSPVYQSGDQVLSATIDLDVLSKVKRSDGESKPFLKALNTF